MKLISIPEKSVIDQNLKNKTEDSQLQVLNRLMLSYCRTYLILLTAGLAGLAMVNLMVDPQRIFRLVEIEGFNREKPAIANSGMRKLKSLAIEQGNFDTLILGTSRAMNGLDPLSPVFGLRNVYNAGLPGANIYEIYQVFEFALKHKKIKTIILGLDFLTFSETGTATADFNQSRFADQSLYQIYFKSLISHQQLVDSLETVRFNFQRDIPSEVYTDRGLRIKKVNYPAYQKIFSAQLRRNTQLYSTFAYGKEQLNLLRQMITTCKANNIQLYLFISPTHAQEVDLMKSTGLFPKFESWKRDLVNIVAEHTDSQKPQSQVQLWDFSGYNTITTETVPVPNKKVEMKWYLDLSHYRKEVGNLMIDLMLNYPSRKLDAPHDFGVVINTQNIASHLASVRVAQRRYSRSQ